MPRQLGSVSARGLSVGSLQARSASVHLSQDRGNNGIELRVPVGCSLGERKSATVGVVVAIVVAIVGVVGAIVW